MTPANEWTPPRLSDKFAEIDRRFVEVQQEVRVIAPVVRQVGGLEADVDTLERGLADIRLALRDVQREALAAVQRADLAANDVIRSARAENMKLIAIIVGAFVSLAGLLIGGVESGVFK